MVQSTITVVRKDTIGSHKHYFDQCVYTGLEESPFKHGQPYIVSCLYICRCGAMERATTTYANRSFSKRAQIFEPGFSA